MNHMVKSLNAAHWYIDSNNVHSLEGCIMYPGGRQTKRPAYPSDVQVTNDRIRVFRPQFFGERFSRKSWWDTVTEHVFDSAEAFLAWCEEHGVEGPPPGPNVYD